MRGNKRKQRRENGEDIFWVQTIVGFPPTFEFALELQNSRGAKPPECGATYLDPMARTRRYAVAIQVIQPSAVGSRTHGVHSDGSVPPKLFKVGRSFMIAARDLSIAWGDSPKNWRWISLSGSRFAEVAELCLVWWLEIWGKINTSMLSLETTYAAYLVCMFIDAYGFNSPADASVGIIGGESYMQTVYLNPDAGQMAGEKDGRYPKEREDGWLEIELGEYFNEGGEDGELEMRLMEVKSGICKQGLIIQGIEIRPKVGHK